MQCFHDVLYNSVMTLRFSFYSPYKAHNPSDLMKMSCVNPFSNSELEDSFHSLDENDPEAGV